MGGAGTPRLDIRFVASTDEHGLSLQSARREVIR
ncbi:MAG: hypothetical protein JWN43_3079 [Gammaproteobacteria bacterium]|nr:hypothetical protein [Gammaproteobacteria bacterium]